MLVHRPHKELLKYKGYPVTISSPYATEDYEKFDAIATQLRVLLESILTEVI